MHLADGRAFPAMFYGRLHKRMKMSAIERQVVRKKPDGKRQEQELMAGLRLASHLDVGLSAKDKPDLSRVKFGSVSSASQSPRPFQIEANFQPMLAVGSIFAYLAAALKIKPF